MITLASLLLLHFQEISDSKDKGGFLFVVFTFREKFITDSPERVEEGKEARQCHWEHQDWLLLYLPSAFL